MRGIGEEDNGPDWLRALPGICQILIWPPIIVAAGIALCLGWLLLPRKQFDRWF